MNWNVGTKIGVGFGLVVVIFLIVGISSYRGTTELVTASELRKLTYQTLSQLDHVLSLVQDIQLGPQGYALTRDESYLEPYASALGRIDGHVQEIRRLTEGNPSQQSRVVALEPLIRERIDVARQTVDAVRTAGPAAGIEVINTGRGKALTDQIRALVGEIEREGNEVLEERVARADAEAVNAKRTIVLGTLAALILATLASVILTRSIARPLGSLTTLAERITVGDLSSNVPVDPRSDEIGVLARTFDRMTQSLRAMARAAEQIAAGDLTSTITPQSAQDVLGNAFARMSDNLRDQIRSLSEGANVIGSATSQIVASTAQLAASATESAAAVSETTTTVEEVRQTAELATQKARYVSEAAQKAAQTSQDGRKSNADVVAGMERIRQQMEAIAASMGRLSEQSQTIGQIIATVEDLAAQSNLLAVNAAIEAAKAGEHGKGFGVVAQEVRSLAEQSRLATGQVRAILGDIQKATTTAVLATEQGTRAVEAGTRQTEIGGEAIQALSSSIIEAAQAATQIAASSQQQRVGVDQVAAAMESIKQASSQNVVSANQLETAARNLNVLGQELKHMVERYKV